MTALNCQKYPEGRNAVLNHQRLSNCDAVPLEVMQTALDLCSWPDVAEHGNPNAVSIPVFCAAQFEPPCENDL